MSISAIQVVAAQATQATQATQAPPVPSAADQPPAPPAPSPADQQPVPAPQDAPALAPTFGTPVGINVPGVGTVIPMTRDQLRALDARGNRLSDQLQSAQGRRDRTARELEDATSRVVRTGLEERLTFLDERILTIEREMAENSALRSSLSANLRVTTSTEEGASEPRDNSDSSGGLIAFMVLFPISLAIARSIWRRSTRRTVVEANSQHEARFAQLEQAIDSVAVEIERVSEGQRFVTRLLREGQPIPDFSAQRAPDGVSVRSGSESAR